jgi:hypothetical protein
MKSSRRRSSVALWVVRAATRKSLADNVHHYDSESSDRKKLWEIVCMIVVVREATKKSFFREICIHNSHYQRSTKKLSEKDSVHKCHRKSNDQKTFKQRF